jgi:hypothetical protein
MIGGKHAMGLCLDTLPEACVGRQKIARPFDGANWFNLQIHSQLQSTQTVHRRIANLLKLSQAQEIPQGISRISRNAARDVEATPRIFVHMPHPHPESCILSFQPGSLIPLDRVNPPEG